ncbi:MAG: hypothetical protein V1728_03550 [Candidatus Micrarchaeota archaeon]
MAGILHLKETGKTPTQTIDEIVLGDKFRAYDKAKLLGGHRLICEMRRDGAGAKLFANAEAGQRIYMILHDEDPEKKYANAYRKLDALASGKFTARQLQDAIVWDARLGIGEKIAYLEGLGKKSPALRKALAAARLGQSKLLTPKRTENSDKKNAAALSGLGFTPKTLAAKIGVACYGKKKMGARETEEILRRCWKDIERDFAKIESDRGGFWGPNEKVSRMEVAMNLARIYRHREIRGIPAGIYETTVSKESNWNNELLGGFEENPNNADVGLYQINRTSVADMCLSERMKQVNEQMERWGLEPFDTRLGQYYENSGKKGRGWKMLEYDVAENSRYRQALAGKNAIEMASWVMVRKMLDLDITCRPDKMNDGQKRRVFEKYNASKKKVEYAEDAMKRFRWMTGR